MSKLWTRFLGEGIETPEELTVDPTALSQAFNQINSIEKTMLVAIEAIVEPDYIGDYIQKGGLIGLEPMGFNAPRETLPDVSHTRLAQVAVNHRQLENAIDRFKESLKNTFSLLNDSLALGNSESDTIAQKALSDLLAYKEKTKQELSQLVLKPKTNETIYCSFEKIDQETKNLQQEFDKYMKLSKKLRSA